MTIFSFFKILVVGRDFIKILDKVNQDMHQVNKK